MQGMQGKGQCQHHTWETCPDPTHPHTHHHPGKRFFVNLCHQAALELPKDYNGRPVSEDR